METTIQEQGWFDDLPGLEPSAKQMWVRSTVQAQLHLVNCLRADDYEEFIEQSQMIIAYFGQEQSTYILANLRGIIDSGLSMTLVNYLTRGHKSAED